MDQLQSEPLPIDAARPAPTWLFVILVIVLAATAVGAALAPYLLVNHPLWLLVLNPWPRHQILVAPHTDLVPFLLVVVPRSALMCWISYELGRHYGPRGTALLEGRAPDLGRGLRSIERLFGRWSAPLLFVMPGWLTSSLAGMSGVTRWLTLLLSATGILGWALLNHHVGGWLEPYLRPVMTFLREHMLEACVVCTAGVLLYQLYVQRRRRAGRPPQIE
jgi:membrane protein DedA with SNARE-associated domain